MSRRGFTLIELMMVIVIIVILSGLLTLGGMTILGSSREAATKSTLEIVQKIVDDRASGVYNALNKAKDVDQFLQLSSFFSEEITRAQNDPSLTPAQQMDFVTRLQNSRGLVANRVNPFVNSDTRTKNVVAMIEWQRLLLPQTWEEADFQRAVKRLPKVDPVNPATENSEVLYFLLTQGTSVGFLSMEAVGEALDKKNVRDTDGNGEMEVVDGWEHPIRLYRWPTKLVKFTSTGGKKFGQLFLPAGVLSSPEGSKDPNNPLNLGGGAIIPPDFYDAGAFHAPLVISAGPDGRFGMRNPNDKTDGGYWGEVMPEDIIPEPPMATVILENPGHRDIFDDLVRKSDGR